MWTTEIMSHTFALKVNPQSVNMVLNESYMFSNHYSYKQNKPAVCFRENVSRSKGDSEWTEAEVFKWMGFRYMVVLHSLCLDERLRQRVHTLKWRLILSFSRGSSPEVPTYIFSPGNNHEKQHHHIYLSNTSLSSREKPLYRKVVFWA